mmetsp:Transcript_49967/g.161899  ORF Transcript_49967/g.161899 Transcript_49967/m.161899 type:complete len:416 (+) Transcript_49967:69-1316(+)
MPSRFRLLSTRAAAAAPALPPQYLQQLNPQLWDRATQQRNHVRVDAATGSKLVSQPRLPPPDEAAFPAGYLDAVRQPHAIIATPPPSQGVFRPPPLALWTGDSFSPPTIRFEELMCEKSGGEAAEWLLSQLYSAGLCLVTQTPPTEKGMRDLSRTVTGGYPTPPAEAVRHGHPTQSNGSDSGPYRTLYGAVWSTSIGGQPSGTSTADSAYSSASLPLHTDMTYHATPPGLQLFNMVSPAPDGSGASTYLDGFAAAHRLRDAHPAAFATLCRVAFSYRSVDTATGWHLEAAGPVLSVDPFEEKTLTGVRHNDLDRLPPRPPASVRDVDGWYAEVERALAAWDAVLEEPGRRLTLSLREGDCTVVHNHRVMHGRESFSLQGEGEARSIIGCYTGVDELRSRWRVCFTKRSRGEGDDC